jgi:hypothetical protein
VSAAATAPFDFSAFASLRPGGAGFEHASTAATPAEEAALAAQDDDALRACIAAAQAAADAETAAEAAAVTSKLESLDASRKEMETELSAAKREAERASASGDAAAADAWHARARRLAASISVNGRARSAAVCRQVFRTADGYRAAFGGGGVIVGVGEMVDDRVEAGFEFELIHSGANSGGNANSKGVASEPPTMRIRVGAPGARSASGAPPRGGARAVVRLSKLGVRGENGTGLINLDADHVTVRLLRIERRPAPLP